MEGLIDSEMKECGGVKGRRDEGVERWRNGEMEG